MSTVPPGPVPLTVRPSRRCRRRCGSSSVSGRSRTTRPRSCPCRHRRRTGSPGPRRRDGPRSRRTACCGTGCRPSRSASPGRPARPCRGCARPLPAWLKPAPSLRRVRPASGNHDKEIPPLRAQTGLTWADRPQARIGPVIPGRTALCWPKDVRRGRLGHLAALGEKRADFDPSSGKGQSMKRLIIWRS